MTEYTAAEVRELVAGLPVLKVEAGAEAAKVKVVADAVQFTTTGRGKAGAGANGRIHRGSAGKEGTADTQKKQYRSRYSN